MIRLARDLPLGLVGGPLSPGEIRSCKAAKEYWTSGGREGIRTLDLSVANAALSQLSYAPNTRVPLFPNIARVEETDNSIRRKQGHTESSQGHGNIRDMSSGSAVSDAWPFTGGGFISVVSLSRLGPAAVSRAGSFHQFIAANSGRTRGTG